MNILKFYSFVIIIADILFSFLGVFVTLYGKDNAYIIFIIIIFFHIPVLCFLYREAFDKTYKEKKRLKKEIEISKLKKELEKLN